MALPSTEGTDSRYRAVETSLAGGNGVGLTPVGPIHRFDRDGKAVD